MSIAENLAAVRDRIAGAEKRSGRDPGSARLVAVSKTWPIPPIDEAVAAGQQLFGENKVQEILEKVPAMSRELRWHLIGHLQSNKIRKVLPHCSMIETLDSVKLARQMDRIAAELGLVVRALIQVNVSNDEAKYGFSVEETASALAEILSFENIEVRGLMTIPAFREDPEKVRPDFAHLRELRDRLAEETGVPLPELSMGMSHDFEIAIEEGATLVRVGSSIFGKRV